MVVSEIKERLSPKKAPPITTATIKGVLEPVEAARPVAMGERATMVPTLVPMEREMKQEATKRPAKSMLPGRRERVSCTVASTLPISLAEWAKAPASTKIHNMSIKLLVLAPRL